MKYIDCVNCQVINIKEIEANFFSAENLNFVKYWTQ